ncbi:hypothetical protein B0H10DRAFT_2275037 [Mycena sp. CBHHK59/15]|nr:hypothetical protein B0H10DRAFT_2275037 [Mycena sp. CBHHK59/15]
MTLMGPFTAVAHLRVMGLISREITDDEPTYAPINIYSILVASRAPSLHGHAYSTARNLIHKPLAKFTQNTHPHDERLYNRVNVSMAVGRDAEKCTEGDSTLLPVGRPASETSMPWYNPRRGGAALGRQYLGELEVAFLLGALRGARAAIRRTTTRDAPQRCAACRGRGGRAPHACTSTPPLADTPLVSPTRAVETLGVYNANANSTA